MATKRTAMPAFSDIAPAVRPGGALSALDARQSVAAIPYEGLASIAEVRTVGDRIKLMAEAVRLSDADEETKATALLEARLSGREVDRRLGQMLDSGRSAGHIARQGLGKNQGKRNLDDPELSTITDLGFGYDYASECAAYARVPDREWDGLIETARQRGSASRETVYRAVKRWLDEQAGIAQTAADRRRAEEKRRREIEEEIAALADSSTELELPPLEESELRLPGPSPEELDAAVGEGPDISREAVAAQKLVTDINSMAHRIHESDAYLPQGPTQQLYVYQARGATRKMISELTVWLRTLNALYEDERRSGRAEATDR
jgi:hypothetical protein